MAAMGRCNASRWLIRFIAFILVGTASFSSAAKVYKVGDESSWVISSNYSAWASSKVFHIVDTIVFVYNKSVHNVLEVSMAGCRSCSSASPIATYATDNDSIAITSHGHRFFICGFPDHCAGGQKLDIHVPNETSGSPAPSDSGTPSASLPAPTGINATAYAPASAAGTMTCTCTVISFALAILMAGLFG